MNEGKQTNGVGYSGVDPCIAVREDLRGIAQLNPYELDQLAPSTVDRYLGKLAHQSTHPKGSFEWQAAEQAKSMLPPGSHIIQLPRQLRRVTRFLLGENN